MGQRAIGSGVITFGLVSIPVKTYTSATAERVSFNFLTKDGHRVKQQYIDAETGKVVNREDFINGYEYTKGKFVTFTKEEIESLRTGNSDNIDITEFVPKDTVNLIEVEKTMYLGPNKGGDKGYVLLKAALEKTNKVAVGKWHCRGREHLVVISPYKDSLVLHQMFYASEVRDFEKTCSDIKVSNEEIKMATQLISKMSSKSFDKSKYCDSFAENVNKAVEQKISGEALSVSPKVYTGAISDLFNALKASLEPASGSNPRPKNKKASKAG